MSVYKMPADTRFHPNSHQYEFMCGVKRTTKKVKRMEKGFRHMEGKEMGHADIESLFCLERNFRTVEVDLPKFHFGQQVHLFWASWFVSAKEPPERIGGKKGKRRPEWFESTIISQPIKLPSGAMYAGHPATGWGYKVF